MELFVLPADKLLLTVCYFKTNTNFCRCWPELCSNVHTHLLLRREGEGRIIEPEKHSGNIRSHTRFQCRDAVVNKFQPARGKIEFGTHLKRQIKESEER